MLQKIACGLNQPFMQSLIITLSFILIGFYFVRTDTLKCTLLHMVYGWRRAMTEHEFVFWLRGYIADGKILNEEQVNRIKEYLNKIGNLEK